MLNDTMTSRVITLITWATAMPLFHGMTVYAFGWLTNKIIDSARMMPPVPGKWATPMKQERSNDYLCLCSFASFWIGYQLQGSTFVSFPINFHFIARCVSHYGKFNNACSLEWDETFLCAIYGTTRILWIENSNDCSTIQARMIHPITPPALKMCLYQQPFW